MSTYDKQVFPKSGPGADLRSFMHNKLLLTLDKNKKVLGILRGYDLFMNLVLDDCIEILPNDYVRDLGRCFVRGSSVSFWECLSSEDTRMA